jgi:hypothetical protein
MIIKLWNLILVSIIVSLSTSITIALDIFPAYTATYGAITVLGGYLVYMLVNLGKEEIKL